MATNLLRLSFVIPVYNIENYIEECVESLEALPVGKDEFEIIIINDGSTDNTLGKCKNLKNKYGNIKLLSFNNFGVSHARNVGIENARGKYICFVDGDDFHCDNTIAEMLEISERQNLDIIRGKYIVFKDDKYINDCLADLPFYNKKTSGHSFLLNSIKYKDNEVVPWLGLFKKDFLTQNGIFFDTSISYEEDHLFFLSCLIVNSCSILQTNKHFYAYRYRESSVTKTPTLRQAEDILKVVSYEENIAEKVNDKKLRKSIRKYESASFYQLTSIYGRVDKKTKKQIKTITTFKVKWRCLTNPYNSHQFFKIFLFTFFRWFVDVVYYIKKR